MTDLEKAGLLSFESQWENYKQKVYRNGMSPSQGVQLRRAFVSGGWIMTQIMEAIACLPEPEHEGAILRLKKEVERLMAGELAATQPKG